MATFTEKTFFNGVVSAGTDTLYTVPASTTAIIKKIHICNTTSTAATITIWIDTDGTTAGDAEAVLKTFSVPANDFISISMWEAMAAASTIKASSGTASALAVRVSGATIV